MEYVVRDHWDQRSVRKIIDAYISDPYIVEDIEMVEFHVKGRSKHTKNVMQFCFTLHLYSIITCLSFASHETGASFMLHQIRRMIGMTIAIMRGRIAFQRLQETFDNPIMPTPTAPGLGLMLANVGITMVHYGC